MNDNHVAARDGGLLRFEGAEGTGPVWINPLQVFAIRRDRADEQRSIVASSDRHEIVAAPAEQVAAAIGAELDPITVEISGPDGDPVPGV
ncbi:hypothetical protein [Sphingomonas sp. LaA6.9]|uniref:hypothetical protein n=1 Tax=Sphingomonas sp. LaA6.9 TaxID=2919914 RepID=UPI001F4F50B7|nr:hypothetical protein [Sphingomonas sp. LaA6.9]MCJ8158831.1 hypothetical protein [Sphingomonas sp. LaA6.9]